MRLINLLEAGSIAGTVTTMVGSTPLAGASVTAYDGDTEVTAGKAHRRYAGIEAEL